MALLPLRVSDADTLDGPVVSGGADGAPSAGPFYFAWVDETETTFGVEHHRMDEYIFSARRILSEGDKPKLELMIENPRVGLLSALRKQWAWFAWDNGTQIVPLFFGRVVGVPSNLQDETVTIMLVAWPTNYTKQLQKVAETLKVAPYWDPVFVDVSQRDNPLSIFEAHSKLIAVDPVTLEVSASDILDAEDGNIDFTADDHFYDSLNISPGAVPKTCIHVDATVSWTQTANGYVDMGDQSITSYSGDGIISDWPKVLSSVGEGLTVFASSAYDAAGIDNIQMITTSWSWQNREKHHENGDALSASVSYTFPGAGGASGIEGSVLTSNSQPGYLDPFQLDEDGDPSPVNIPMSASWTDISAYAYRVKTTLILEYRANRPHTERLIFNLFADVQSTTLDPLVTEDSEVISITGANVGIPIIDLLNWTTISETAVSVGTVIFPNDPRLPGGQSAQVCVVAGTAGVEQPDFSDVPGETTVDGTVTWASLGASSPTDSAPNWTGVTNVPLGAIILPQRPIMGDFAAYVRGGLQRSPPVGTPISAGTYLSGLVCITGGMIGFGTTAVMVPTGIPSGSHYFICTQAGTTGAQYIIPNFNNTLHAVTNDGTVKWTCIGQGEIPVGGTAGNVVGTTYFARDRGHRSVEHLICRARARLRYAARCVNTTFQTSYARGTELTLRKSVTLHDPRIPGGLMTGKIAGIEMIADNGSFTTNVTLQSSVGKALTLEEVDGDPTYVADGYVDSGYQAFENAVVLLPVTSDVGYSPLVAKADEDGITFPLTKSALVVAENVVGSVGAQRGGILTAFDSMKKATETLAQPSSSPFETAALQLEARRLSANSVSFQLQQHPVYYELELKPLNGNGGFNHVYHLTCSTLQLPKMIDLEEESTS